MSLAAALIAACHSAACAPPPAGRGGSDSGGGGGRGSASQRQRVGNIKVRNETNKQIRQKIDQIKTERAAGKRVPREMSRSEMRLLQTHSAAKDAVRAQVNTRKVSKSKMLARNAEHTDALRKFVRDYVAKTGKEPSATKIQAQSKRIRSNKGVTAAAMPRGGAVPTKAGYGKYKSSIGGRSPSLRWPHLYDILRAKGYDKSKSARISNSRVGYRKSGKIKGLPYRQAENPKALAKLLKK